MLIKNLSWLNGFNESSKLAIWVNLNFVQIFFDQLEWNWKKIVILLLMDLKDLIVFDL